MSHPTSTTSSWIVRSGNAWWPWWLPLLAEIAFTFFQDSAGRRPMPSGRLLGIIEKSEKRPVPLDGRGRRMKTLDNVAKRQQADYLLKELRDPEEALRQIVAERFRPFVRDAIGADRCSVLLDAWDEVRPQQALRQRLEGFSRDFPNLRILLTSRIVGYDPVKPPIPEAKELELLAFDLPQTKSFVRVWFGDGGEAAHQFLAMLRQNHPVRGLARIPLMLALKCRAWSECTRTGKPFPSRRVELHDCCLRGLLRDWKIKDDKPDAGDEAGALRVTDS